MHSSSRIQPKCPVQSYANHHRSRGLCAASTPHRVARAEARKCNPGRDRGLRARNAQRKRTAAAVHDVGQNRPQGVGKTTTRQGVQQRNGVKRPVRQLRPRYVAASVCVAAVNTNSSGLSGGHVRISKLHPAAPQTGNGGPVGPGKGSGCTGRNRRFAQRGNPLNQPRSQLDTLASLAGKHPFKRLMVSEQSVVVAAAPFCSRDNVTKSESKISFWFVTLPLMFAMRTRWPPLQGHTTAARQGPPSHEMPSTSGGLGTNQLRAYTSSENATSWSGAVTVENNRIRSRGAGSGHSCTVPARSVNNRNRV